MRRSSPLLERSGTRPPEAPPKCSRTKRCAKIAPLNDADLAVLFLDLDDLDIIGGLVPLDGIKAPIDIRRYLPMIAQLSFQYWSRLPIDVRSWMDVEDVVQDGCVCAMRACELWTLDRGRPSTLIYTAVGNMLKNRLLERFFAQKRHAATVSLDDTTDGHAIAVTTEAFFDREREAIQGVELVLRDASDDTRRFLSETLLSPAFRDLRRYGQEFLVRVFQELQVLVATHHVTLLDFRLVASRKWDSV